jgi:thiamine-monophosphate kinase
VACTAIDLSDGLLGDLGHVLKASGVGATVELDALPRSAVLARQPATWQQTCVLAGGDDYELLFSAPAAAEVAVRAAAAAAGVAVTAIGRIDVEPGLRVVDADGRPVATDGRGFDHFA